MSCEETYDVAHGLHCPKSNYTHIRHNDICYSFSNLLDEVCDDVEVETCFKTVANRSNTADDDNRFGITANGLFGSHFK